MNIPDTLPQPTWGDAAKNLLFIAIALGAAYYLTVHIGIEDIRASVASAGIWAPFIVILLKATTIVVVPLGGTPIYPIAGAIFGFWTGFLLTFIGDVIGFTIAFYLSRFFGRSILRFVMSKQQLPMIEKLVEKASQTKTFIKARIFFAGFPELFAYAAGLTKVKYPLFISAQMGLHAIGGALLVAFGGVLVSGNKVAVIGIGIIVTILALSGIWWFHADLKRAG